MTDPVRGVSLVLTCDSCGDSVRPYVPFKLARLGGLRLHVSTDWYVDGGAVACPNCRTEEQTALIHSESHGDRDLRHAADELGIEISRVRTCDEHWEVVA